MKLKLWQKIALPALLVVSFGIGLGGSIAWFDTRTNLTPQTSFEGVSEGAYFAYGNGKPRGSGNDEPYGISSPRHLYNLAWLQYLGLIDDVFNQNPATSEAYFELANDIDMTGWNLPPIGTTSNPFMGHFNGNGYTITGLTVSNLESDFSSGSSKKPERASSYSSDVPHIVGLFGVVGPYYGSGLAYSSSADAITDLNVSGITVKSSVDNGTLAGLVAGYVNGPISSVAITDATTSSGTQKSTLDLHAANGSSATSAYSAGKNAAGNSFSRISEFGTVGYAENTYIDQAKRKTSSVYGYAKDTDDNFSAQSQGEQSGFGGSIDMKTMYNGIRAVWDTYSSTADGIAEYPTKRTIVYDVNGSLVSDTYSDNVDVPAVTVGSGSNRWSYQYFQAEQKDGGKVTSSYTFARRTASNYYMYLYGDKTHSVSNALTTTTLRQTEGTVITISREVSGTTYYLCYDNGITYTTSAASATEWVFKNGKIFYPDNSGNTTSKTYLYKNGTNLGTNASGSTFVYDSINQSYYVTESATNYYLSFNTSSRSWVFVNDRTATLIHSGSHYLTASSWSNNASLADTTLDSAPSWEIPANGSSGKIYTTQNGTYYYLRLNGNNIVITTSNGNATTWNVSSDGSVIYNGRYCLTYDSGWKTFYKALKYKIRDADNHYLSADGTSSLAVTDAASATEWYTDDNSTYYYKYNGNNYFIVNATSGNYYSLSTSGTKYSKTNESYFYSTYTEGMWFWETTYYLYLKYANNSWSISIDDNNTTAKNGGTKLTFEEINNPFPTITIERDYDIICDKNTVSTTTGTSYNEKSTSTGNSSYTTKPTYFPLRQEKTGDVPNGIPQQSNTGYVISGANDTTGDIRISDYNANSGGSTFIGRYGSKGIPLVYSRNDGGDFKIYDTENSIDLSANYEKFSTTRDSLEKIFKADSANIYGLHFVGATVSYSGGTGSYAGSSVYAEKAIINKETYTNYELPKDCIDFNLKEKGYVNFIAGTYFSGSDNCFFSLHDIGRNANQSLNYIKEIIEIYRPKSNQTYSYQYKYSDNTYSVPFKYVTGVKKKLDGSDYVANQFLPALDSANYNSTPLFKTAWIKKNTLQQNYAYYFEIPINAGEYCLSSVADTKGAYMMYLDIGANAAKMNRTVIAEYIKEITTTWNFPKGLALVATGTSPASVNAYNSYCVVIDSSYGGTVTLSRESDTAGTATYSDTTNKIKMGYYNDDIAVTGSPNTLEEIAPIATQTDNIRRITYFDYNTGDGGLTKIIVTRKNSETPTIERFLYDSQSSTWVIETDPEKAILYDSQGVTVESAADAVRLYTEATMAACFTTMENNGTVVLGFKALSYASGTLTISYNLNGAMQQTGNGQFFVVSDYTINMTYTGPDGTSARVTVLSVVSTYNTLSITFTINGTTVSAANQKITIPISS
ncbi:MAG: hypothetical protein IJS37_02655 [Bacilli bacterium]|nr:hypothetical protein [Bacilli bacterium]